ncbi:MAG: hypothetical protein R3Y67_02155 [Eubacteriales bacterium]
MKNAIKYITFFVTFIMSIFIFSQFINQGNAEMTVEMNAPTIPYMNVVYEGQVMNHLQGNYEQMDVAYQRDSITPLDDSRNLVLQIHNMNQGIESITYEVRTLEGERLIERSEISEYSTNKGIVTVDFVIKDLIESDQEYSLMIQLDVQGSESLYYYTKIKQTTTSYAEEKIAFAIDFHNTTLNKEMASTLAVYLEPSSDSDNTTYYHVDIESSLSQVTWGTLDVTEIGTPLVTLEELGTQTGVIRIESLYEIAGSDKTVICKVEEYYRVSYGTQRMYLLNYQRITEEIINLDEFQLVNNKIQLGIADPNFTTVESEGGTILAFTSGDLLYTYNIVENKFSCLFNYFEVDELDIRDYINNNDIQIISVEETGNVRFLAYGYKNRGSREGYVGVQMYYYDSNLNTIEEEIYIPYTKSAELLNQNISKVSYLSRDNKLYLMIESTLYEINISELSYQVITSNLQEGEYFVSDSNEMIVWQDDGYDGLSDELILMDFITGEQTTITAPYGNLIKPLGFVGNDLLYGLVEEDDVMTNDMGQILYPMYALEIKNQEGEIVKEYATGGAYVMNCTIDGNHILVERVEKITQGATGQETFYYTSIADDQIINNATQNYYMNEVEVASTYEYNTIIQIILKSVVDANNTVTTIPEIVLYEGERSILLESEEDIVPQYYVYAQNGIENTFAVAGDAVLLAKELEGVVVNQQGKLVWESGNLAERNQIMAITGYTVDPEQSQLAASIDTILQYEGVSQSTQNQVDQGKTAIEILEYSLADYVVLDLTGCAIDDMLFYLNQDIPILVLLENEETMLLTGFNSSEVVVLDASTGILAKKTITEMRILCEENGNHFIGYISNTIDG